MVMFFIISSFFMTKGLFTAGEGPVEKGGDIEFECKQLEGGKRLSRGGTF